MEKQVEHVYSEQLVMETLSVANSHLYDLRGLLDEIKSPSMKIAITTLAERIQSSIDKASTMLVVEWNKNMAK